MTLHFVLDEARLTGQQNLVRDVNAALSALDATSKEYATQFVDALLTWAQTAGCSDIHLQPTPRQLELRCRLDGVLQPLGEFPPGDSADVVTRLKVVAKLLTYRTDMPQEGRIPEASDSLEMRVSTFPTLFGERAVVRLFAADARLQRLDQLGIPDDALNDLRGMLHESSGALLITGPAGSGKTTLAYACLRSIVAAADGMRSIMSLEDPVEVAVPGVSQSQTNAAAGLDLCSGLKSLLRQDPEVIFVGEIRDAATAEIAFQAALTGQLVISTFHAGSTSEAIRRLLDMGIEPYVLRSGLLGVVSQRLVRRLCECAIPNEHVDQLLGLPIENAYVSQGCDACRQTGFAGRIPLVEFLTARRPPLDRAILSRESAIRFEDAAREAGTVSLWTRAIRTLENHATDPREIRRVFGVHTFNSLDA